MKAILDATGFSSGDDSSDSPMFLREFLGKPFLVHVIEKLVRLGSKEIYVILHHAADQVEEFLGDGERWGVQLYFFLVRDPEVPLSTLSYSIESWGDDVAIWASAYLIPSIESIENGWFSGEAEALGWAIAPVSTFAALPASGKGQDLVDTFRTALPFIELEWLLSSVDRMQWLRSIETALKYPSALLMPTDVREIKGGVWAARDSQVDSSAKLEAPLFLGSQCQIYAAATVGPYASVERGSVIDEETTVVKSVVLPYSYVGQHLDLHHSIVDRATLCHVEHGTEIKIDDEMILAPLGDSNPTSTLGQLLEKSAAFLMLFLFSPLVLFGVIRREPQVAETLVLPATSTADWKTMQWLHWDDPSRQGISFTGWLLSLFPVLVGDAHLVGLPPRSSDEVNALPKMWRDAYLASKVGTATLADVTNVQSEEAQLTTEMYYIAHASLKTDAKVLGLFLLRRFFGSRLAN